MRFWPSHFPRFNMKFFSPFRKFFMDCVTEDLDNSVIDVVRVIWLVGITIFMGLSIFQTLHTMQFDAVAYATGFSTICGANGIALWLKNRSEPDYPHTPKESN